MAAIKTKTEPEAKPESNLILDSLEVKNFRAFRHLQIPKLGRVNLITGRNNVGKSSLLEALWLYARRGSAGVLRTILLSRNEMRPRLMSRGFEDSYANEGIDDLSDSIRITALFFGRAKDGDEPRAIEIRRLTSDDGLQISFSKEIAYEILERIQRRNIPTSRYYTSPTYGIRVKMSDVDQFDFLADDIFSSRIASPPNLFEIPVQMVNADGLSDLKMASLWDRISLTKLEESVTASLRIVAPAIERVSLIGERGRTGGRIPFVKIDGDDEPLPMRSLGDGVNRLFGMTLALASASNGFVLIDEIENGLHYSTQKDVWRLIFATARQLNVQVFATTHSWDCIEAFQMAAAESPEEGVLVRLHRRGDDVFSTVFDEEELAVVTRDGLEVR